MHESRDNEHLVLPTDLLSRSVPASRVARIFQFPLVRILVVAAFLMPVVVVNSVLVFQVIDHLQEPLATRLDIVRMVVTFALLLASYRLYCRVHERRPAWEVGFEGFWREAGVGAALGAAAVTTVVLILWFSGAYLIEGFSSAWVLPRSLVIYGVGAFFQDLVLLAVLFRLFEELTGTWLAVIGSLLAFAVVHGANPNATAGSTVALFFSSIIIVAPFILTRRIWLSWGFHASWNFAQAGVFGMPNSGYQFPGWMQPAIDGPTWLTGGSFGIEASIVAIGLDTLVGLVLLGAAMRRGQILQPRWRRVGNGEAVNARRRLGQGLENKEPSTEYGS